MKPIENLRNIARTDLVSKEDGTLLVSIRMAIDHDGTMYIENKGKVDDKKTYYGITLSDRNNMRLFEKYDGSLYPHNCHVTSYRDREISLDYINSHMESIKGRMFGRKSTVHYKVNLPNTKLFIRFYNDNMLNKNTSKDYIIDV